MNSVGPFPAWLAAAGIAAGVVWLVAEVDKTGGYVLAGILLLSVAVLRPGVVQSLDAILSDLSGHSTSGGTGGGTGGTGAGIGT